MASLLVDGQGSCCARADERDAKTKGGRMTLLDKPLRRELNIGGRAYTLTIDPEHFKLVEKGRRKGIELAWTDLVNGDAALATALQASLAQAR
jgi:hypothetical protein